jgi:hypothetical protein
VGIVPRLGDDGQRIQHYTLRATDNENFVCGSWPIGKEMCGRLLSTVIGILGMAEPVVASRTMTLKVWISLFAFFVGLSLLSEIKDRS